MVTKNMMQKLTEQEMSGKDVLVQLVEETFNAGRCAVKMLRDTPLYQLKAIFLLFLVMIQKKPCFTKTNFLPV